MVEIFSNKSTTVEIPCARANPKLSAPLWWEGAYSRPTSFPGLERVGENPENGVGPGPQSIDKCDSTTKEVAIKWKPESGRCSTRKRETASRYRLLLPSLVWLKSLRMSTIIALISFKRFFWNDLWSTAWNAKRCHSKLRIDGFQWGRGCP